MDVVDRGRERPQVFLRMRFGARSQSREDARGRTGAPPVRVRRVRLPRVRGSTEDAEVPQVEGSRRSLGRGPKPLRAPADRRVDRPDRSERNRRGPRSRRLHPRCGADRRSRRIGCIPLLEVARHRFRPAAAAQGRHGVGVHLEALRRLRTARTAAVRTGLGRAYEPEAQGDEEREKSSKTAGAQQLSSHLG